jgi:uncharacterized protein
VIYLKWSTIQLQKFRNKGLAIDEMVDVHDLKEIEPQIRDLSPIHVTGRADISSEKITFHLRIQGTFVLPCARTLNDVHYPIDIQTLETFLLKSLPYEEMEEEEVHRVQGDVIDLLPIVKELLLLEVPMQVFSDEAEGELPSGKGWEVMSEEDALSKDDEEKPIDPRLAALSKFFEKKDES